MRDGSAYSGLTLLASQKWFFFLRTFECTGKGYVERETSLASLERGGCLCRARFAHLSLLNAPVRGM